MSYGSILVLKEITLVKEGTCSYIDNDKQVEMYLFVWYNMTHYKRENRVIE